jgi:hypothetical protein
MRRAKRIALAVGAGLLTLVCADLVLRLAVNSPVYMMALPATPALFRYNPNGRADQTIAGDLGRTTPTAADDQQRRVATRIDGFGFRNEAGARDRVLDVVLLGDSFGFGVGTTQDETVASVLRDRFSLATYNLSMPWTGPWAQYLNLAVEAAGLRLHEDTTVVWLLFAGNDLDDVYGDLDVTRLRRNGTWGQLAVTARRIRNRSPIYRRLRQVVGGVTSNDEAAPPVVVLPATFVDGHTLLFLKPYADARQRDRQAILAHPHFESLRQTLAAARTLTARLDVRLAIALAPSKSEVYGWALDAAEPWSTPPESTAFAQALSDLCAESGVPFLDLKPSFVRESKPLFERTGDLLWWRDDSHWNARGHELAARLIHQELLVPAKRAGGPPR